MSLIKRIEKVEALLGMNDTDPGTEAVIIYRQDCSLKDVPPEPVTKFSFSGHEIHRELGEMYPDFETRALKAALELLPARRPGQAAPTPVLIADGCLE